MSAIASCVEDALDRISKGNPVGALRDICGAIEGTIKKSGLKGKSEYKLWVADQLNLILAVGFPGLTIFGGMCISYSHPELPATDPPDTPTLSDIIYHVVRCGLYHTGGLPENIEFSDGVIAGGGPDRSLQIPSDFVLGLILAVVCASSNGDERIGRDPVIEFNGTPLHVNMYWGKKQALIQSLAYTRMAATMPVYGPHEWKLL